jgi:transcriptional regulator GlxA family with amidase domain
VDTAVFQGKRTYAFLTLPNYSLIALANALEPLRMANRVANRTLYEWQIASLRGEPVAASSGLQMTPTFALADVGKVDVLFVCGGINVREAVTTPLTKALWLRTRPRRLAQSLQGVDPLGKRPLAARGVSARRDP